MASSHHKHNEADDHKAHLLVGAAFRRKSHDLSEILSNMNLVNIRRFLFQITINKQGQPRSDSMRFLKFSIHIYVNQCKQSITEKTGLQLSFSLSGCSFTVRCSPSSMPSIV